MDWSRRTLPGLSSGVSTLGTGVLLDVEGSLAATTTKRVRLVLWWALEIGPCSFEHRDAICSYRGRAFWERGIRTWRLPNELYLVSANSGLLANCRAFSRANVRCSFRHCWTLLGVVKWVGSACRRLFVGFSIVVVVQIGPTDQKRVCVGNGCS